MTSVKKIVDTEIKVSTLDGNGNVVATNVFKNEIVNEGVSVIARLLVDPAGPRPSHIYARFADDLTGANGTSDLGVSNSTVNVFDFTPTEDNAGCLREPVFSTAKLEANNNIVDGKVTFFFRITADSTLSGSFNSTMSKLYYLGLAAAKDISDPNQDLIVSLLTVDPALEIPVNGQLAIDYTMKFTA